MEGQRQLEIVSFVFGGNYGIEQRNKVNSMLFSLEGKNPF